jgi:hypothetical protein
MLNLSEAIAVVDATGNATLVGGVWVNIVLPLLVLFFYCH